jgi:hypothetical protein
VTPDEDPIALFLQSDRTYLESRREAETLERTRAEALVRAASVTTVAHLAALVGVPPAQMRRQIARARRLIEPSDLDG